MPCDLSTELLSTCDVSDAMQTLGYMNVFLPTPKLITYSLKHNENDAPRTTVCGPAYTVQLVHATETSTPNYPHNVFDECPSNHIMVIAAPEDITNAVLGGLSAARVAQLGCTAVVTNGYVRDLHELQTLGIPIFARGPSIQSSRGRTRASATNVSLKIDTVAVYPGDTVYADIHGVAVVPCAAHAQMIDVAHAATLADRACRDALAHGHSLADTLVRFRG